MEGRTKGITEDKSIGKREGRKSKQEEGDVGTEESPKNLIGEGILPTITTTTTIINNNNDNSNNNNNITLLYKLKFIFYKKNKSINLHIQESKLTHTHTQTEVPQVSEATRFSVRPLPGARHTNTRLSRTCRVRREKPLARLSLADALELL